MNVALFLPNWVGDAVMATPAIRAIRNHYRGARLVGVCRPYVADVVAGSDWFDELIFHDPRGRREHSFRAAVRRLRRARAHVSVLFPNSLRSALLAWLGGCRQRIGYARYGRGMLLSRKLNPLRDAVGRPVPTPIIGDYNHLAMALGISDPGCRLELFTTPTDEQAADRVWVEQGLGRAREVVGVNSGGAFGAAKDWPAESFATLARELVDRRGSHVLVLCGPHEREKAARIVRLAGRPGVKSLADYPLSLGLTKACVRRVDLLVTTDSGPRHFAAAFDRPVVTLFGPTHIAWTETYFPKAVHLQKQVACGPCQQRTCPEGHHRCMRQLTTAQVFAAVAEQLRQFPPQRQGGLRHAG